MRKKNKTMFPLHMLVIRSNLDDFPVMIGSEAVAAFVFLQNAHGEQWIEKCNEHITRLRASAANAGQRGDSETWPTWDVTELVNAALCRWDDSGHCVIIDSCDDGQSRNPKLDDAIRSAYESVGNPDNTKNKGDSNK